MELVQATGCTKKEVLKLVEYVYSREKGELGQEVGGVMTTLAAFCATHGLNMISCGEYELNRIWDNVEKICEKNLNKPRNFNNDSNQTTS